MNQRLALQPLARARLDQKIDARLLEQAGANALLAIGSVLRLDYDRLNALEVQKMREHQPRRPGSHNSDLCLCRAHARTTKRSEPGRANSG